jgi:SIR2-like domain
VRGLDDLSETLARASAIVAGLGEVPAALPVVQRPGFLVGGDPQPIIERLAGAERITFVLGAGASMEAGLPSWRALVRDLLHDVAPRSLTGADRAAWLDAVAESGVQGMAATARAFSRGDAEFVRRVQHHVYRGRTEEHFDPGPLVREVAAWKRDHPGVQLATFNYDSLLERALQDAGLAVEAREDDQPEPEGVAVVRHLHGRLTGSGDDAIVLTEGDYARWPAGGWQDRFMAGALDGLCVFVGLSFTDQNLLRWVYRAGGDHLALLARQSSPRLTPAVRRELERGSRARLRRANVTVHWADFYAELAQLLHEARRRPPQPYAQRAQQRAERGRRRCLPRTGVEARQRVVREILAGSLAGVRAAIAQFGIEAARPALGLGLWGIDYERREIALWGSSDRIHVDLSTITPVPFAWASEWVAVEAVTQGSVVEWDPRTYASRWRTVRGIPLVWTGSGGDRIVVGAATLTADEPAGESIFDRAEAVAPGIRRTIDVELHDQLVGFWD